MATSPQGEEFKLTLLAAGVGQTFYFWDEDVFHLAALSLDFSEAPAPVPDPTTFILTATGLTATAWRVRRRRRETLAC